MRTLRELAAQAGVSHEAVRKAVKSGRLKAVRDESTALKQLLVTDEEAERWLASRASTSTSARISHATDLASSLRPDVSPAPEQTPSTLAALATSRSPREELSAALATTDWASVIAELGLTPADLARAVVDVVADQQQRRQVS